MLYNKNIVKNRKGSGMNSAKVISMKKFVPYEKLSKKEQRKINLSKRNTWNGINPATRVAKTDNRKRKMKDKTYYEDF